MKKIILFILVALALVPSAFAISYNGSSIRNYPSDYNNRLKLDTFPWDGDSNCFTSLYDSDNNTTITPALYCSNDGTMRRATIGNFVEIDLSELTGSIIHPISNRIGEYPNTPFGGYMTLSSNSSGSYDVIFQANDSQNNPLFSGNIGSLSSSSFGSGALPNRLVLFMSSEYSKIQNSDNTYSIYLREINFCLYVNQKASNVCFTKTYINSTYANGLTLWSGTDTFFRPGEYGGADPFLSGFVYSFIYTPYFSHYGDAGNKQQYIEFTTGTGANSLTKWLGGSSSYFIQDGITPPIDGSGATDYYASCGTLDVGCYIAGTATRFGDAWIKARDDVIAWILPDINFNGMSDTCYGHTESGSIISSTGSTPIVSSTGITSGIVQKFANLFIILVPVAPLQDSQVCTFDGVKQIHYHSSTATVVDILIVLFAFIPVLLSSKPHHD